GVVDQDVEPLPAGDNLAHDLFDAVLVGQVTDDRLHLGHEPAELLQPPAVAVDGQDVRTFGGQELGCRTADSRRGTGEENGLAGEPRIHLRFHSVGYLLFIYRKAVSHIAATLTYRDKRGQTPAILLLAEPCARLDCE